MRKVFHPQSVAAYAATKNFEVLRADYPDYLYREVALNPTNRRSRAAEWEADIINDFRAFPAKRELVTHRDTAQGRLLNLSRPIITRISSIAGEVSMGKMDAPEYQSEGSDEIASLSVSFNRMRRTVEQAMKMLSDSLKR